MILENQKITLDLYKRNSQDCFAIKGDIGTRKIDIYVTQKDSIFNLVGLQVLFYCQTPQGNKVFSNVVISNAELGKLQVELPTSVIGVTGTHTCCLVFREGQKQILSFDFFVNVCDSIYDEVAIIATNEFSVLTNALNKAEQYNKELENSSKGLETKYTNRLNSLDSQMADIAKIRLEEDIQGTIYKKGQQIDVNYLQLIQSQKYASVQWKLQNNENVIICCQGDSLTYGQDVSSADRIAAIPPHTFDRAKITYPESLQNFLNQIYPSNITVINRGYSGDCCEKSYKRWLPYHNGDLTIIMLGTNDSRSSACGDVGNIQAYLYWYEQLIVRELLWGKAIIMLKSPRTLWANDKRVEAFSNAIELLANKYNIPIIDTTPFISSYDLDIWSDLTPENTNKICTHFTSKGYQLIGAGVASTLMGESIVNTKLITSGDTLLAREQVDSVKFISNTLALEVDANYTPFERTDQKSIIARMGAGSKIAYSFYTDEENLLVIPTVYCYAGKKFKMTLDFGVEQPYVNLTTKYEPQQLAGTKITGIFDGTSSTTVTYRKSYMKDQGIEPLQIVRKGWHTIVIESDDCVFSGLEFLGLNEWIELKKSYTVKNLGGNILSANYNGKYVDLVGKVTIPMPLKINSIEIAGLPSNFTALNRQASISNKLTESQVATYTENNKHYIEVTNLGVLSDSRVAYVDFRLFGYYA